MELKVKVKLLEKQKEFLEKQVHVSASKAIIFDMRIDLAEKDYQIDIRKKLLSRTIEQYAREQHQTIVFACHLFGLDRQVHYRIIRRRVERQSKAEQVVGMIVEIR